MACDVSWQSKLLTLNSENMLLKGQVESVVQERENIKLEFQKLFNSIKVTRAQHKKEVDDLIQCVTQKTYAYGDVRGENQDLLMTISELKTLGKRVCVTPFNKQIVHKAMNVTNTKVNANRSKPVTLQSTSKPEQGVESSHSVRRSTSKDIKSKNSILNNTKSSSTYVWKTLNSACLDSNKSNTKTSNVCQTHACISNSKTVKACVNVVKDGSNIMCISCGNDVFLNSHEKCVSHNALSRKSSVKRALFTSPLAAKSKNLGATFVVTKSRLSVVKTPTTTSKVSSALTPSSDSRTTWTLSSYMNNKIATSKKWQKWFDYQHGFNWTPRSKSDQSQSSVIKSKTSIVDSGCSKHMTGNLQLLRNFIEKFIGTVRSGNDHFAAITGYEDYVQGNLTICHVYYVEGLGHNLFSVGQFCDGDLEGKIKKASLPPKLVPSIESKLELIHMDLCGPMRVASINGKKYIIVIVDDYSRYTWVYFLRTKDEASDMIIDFVNQTSSQEVSDDSAANTTDNDHTSSSSSIIIDQDDALPVVSSSDEQVSTAPNFPVINEVGNEFVQEDVADFNGNVFHNAPQTPEFEVAKSSSIYQDPSNMHQFHQQHRSADRWTKNHPLEQVIGDPSKPVMTRKRLQTNVEVCMYALIVSSIKPKNIKEAMLDRGVRGAVRFG
ncbi:retrovirus-related pol polyprotein from transposon TNT 1-94 [Tanacetum coccineum]